MDRRQELMQAFFKMRSSLKRIHTGEMSNAMINALLHIDDCENEEGISASQLCKTTGVSMPAMARTLRELETRGLIERRQDKTDRRIFYVGLTEGGRKDIHEGKKRIDRQLKRLLELLGDDDTGELLRIANKLAEVMDIVRQEEENR